MYKRQQLDLGHVAIFRGLARLAQLGEREESQLFDIYQRKAVAELRDFLAAHVSDSAAASRFEGLLKLSGDAGVLAQAKKLLGGLAPEIDEALQSLEAVAAALQVSHADVSLYFDLTELRGYHYHTGLVFAAYVPGSRAELAKGGRYDAVGEAFGRSRPATGFSADLKSLLAYFSDADAAAVIQAPAGDDAALRAAIAALREQGERVLQALPGDSEAASGRVLRLQDGQWRVATI